MTNNVKIVSRDEFRTVISADNMKYTIAGSRGKGIELLIDSGMAHQFTVRLWLPEIAQSTVDEIEGFTELSIFPVPKEVLDDIEIRTRGKLYKEDLAKYGETEPGKEFFIRTTGNILFTNF
jgi:hypothetical protein